MDTVAHHLLYRVRVVKVTIRHYCGVGSGLYVSLLFPSSPTDLMGRNRGMRGTVKETHLAWIDVWNRRR